MPKTSVIVPTFNSGRFLESAINSVLLQSFTDFELIVIDDGSSDNSVDIIKSERRIDRYVRQDNRGPSAARNKGISLARGRYIAFLDADDLWFPNKLSMQIKFLEDNPGVSMVGCSFAIIDNDGECLLEKDGPLASVDADLYRALLVSNVVRGGPSGIVVRSECLRMVGGFNEALRGSEDRDLWLRIASYNKVAFLDQVLFKYRVHQENSHKNIPLMMKNKLEFIALHKDEYDFCTKKKALGYVFLDAAREYSADTRQLQAFVNVLCSMWHCPFPVIPGDDKYHILLKCLCGFKKRRIGQ